jgi:MmpS family membrane protein
MGRAHGPTGGALIDRGADTDYDESRNAVPLAYDARNRYSLLVFRRHTSRKDPLVTQYAPSPTAQAPQRPSNGLGTAGFVVGLIGLVFSFVPLIGVVAWPLVILGVIFSAIGISRAGKGRATNKGLAIAGLVVSIVGLAMCVLWGAVVTKAANDVEDEANRVAVIVYEVTGDAAGVDVTYTTFGDATATNQETVTTLPWSKEINVTGLLKEGQLIVTTNESGGSVTCTVTVDGKEVRTATASGPFAMASCDTL